MARKKHDHALLVLALANLKVLASFGPGSWGLSSLQCNECERSHVRCSRRGFLTLGRSHGWTGNEKLPCLGKPEQRQTFQYFRAKIWIIERDVSDPVTYCHVLDPAYRTSPVTSGTVSVAPPGRLRPRAVAICDGEASNGNLLNHRRAV